MRNREHLSNLPPHHDNAIHKGTSISQPCYEEKCLECVSDGPGVIITHTISHKLCEEVDGLDVTFSHIHSH